MKLEWLRYYVEIASTGSLNKAAENLYLSQPALTKIIHALEKEIGETLLYRKKTGVFLTAQGEIFLTFAQNVLGDYQDYLTKKFELHDSEQQSTPAYAGTLELVMSSSILQTYYQDILTALRQTFPAITIYCIEADALEATKLLTDDIRQIGLLMCIRKDMLKSWKNAGLAHREICRSDVVGCVARNSHYAQRAFINKSEIAAEKLISIEFAKKSFTWPVGDNCGLRTTNLDMIKQILLSEKDACVMSALLVAEQKLLSPDIIALPVSPTLTASICLVHNQRALEQALYKPIFLKTVEDILRRSIQPS